MRHVPWKVVVARVIANRQDPSAESVGLLQMDSTVMYGLGIAGGVPNQEQLDTDTPYNTYLHQGLPPTPIGAAGDAAIQAAQTSVAVKSVAPAAESKKNMTAPELKLTGYGDLKMLEGQLMLLELCGTTGQLQLIACTLR